MACTDRQKLVGKRMRRAAEDRELGAYQVADLMDVEPNTIYRWWRGDQWPGLDVIERYAQVTEREFGWFFEREGEGWQAKAAAGILDILDMSMHGEDPAVAYDKVTGNPAELSQRERRLISAGAEGLRQHIEATARQEWEKLSPARRRQVLAEIVGESLRRLAP